MQEHTSPAAPVTLTLQDALQLAVREHRAGNLQQAEKLYRAILEKDPQNADAAHNLGVLAVQHEQIRAALPLFQTAINARPQQIQFWKSAINALYEVGDYERCISLCTQYLGLNPTDAEAMAEQIRAGIALMDDNSTDIPDSVRQTLQQAQALQPESPAVLRAQSRVHLRAKEPEQALEAAEKACRADPAHPENRLVRAAALLACKRIPEIQAVLTELLAARPNYAEALCMQAFLHIQTKQLEAAETCLRKALQLRPHLRNGWRLLATILQQQGRRLEAIDACEHCLALRPSDCSILVSLAELYRLELRYEQARALLERALHLAPDNISALTNMAVLLHSMTHVMQAARLYNRILELEPGKKEVLHNLGALLLEQGNYENAASIFDRIVTESPDKALYRLHLLQALVQTFAIERAQQVADALEADPALMCQLDASNIETLNQIKERLDAYADTPQAEARYKARLLATHQTARELCTPLPAAEQGHCPITALIHMGRSGSNFFHSLIDGHPELVTLPGMYFAGWFEDETIKRFTPDTQDPQWREKLVSKILTTYEAQFDAHSTTNTPGKPFGDCEYLAEASGFTNLGPNRDMIFQVDKDLFVREMLALLRPLPTVSHAQCFECIHRAYSLAAGQHQWEHNAAPHLFYHIHNPADAEMAAFLRAYPRARFIKLARHPIQGLESWMRSDLNVYDEFHAKSLVAERNAGAHDSYLTACWQKAAIKASQRIHPVQDAFVRVAEGVTVRIEDVKRRPRQTMPAIAEWMGIAPHDALYDSAFNGLQYWGPVSSSTKAITGFDTASVDKPLGRLFGPRDLVIMETLFYPMLVNYGYKTPDDAAFLAGLKTIRPWLDEPLEFEQQLFRQYSEPKKTLQQLPAYQTMHTALRNTWKMLKQGFDSKACMYPLLLQDAPVLDREKK